MSNLYVPPCPTDCTGSVADVSFNECAPENHWGEVSKIYVAPADTADFTNVSLLPEWTALLADTGDNKIRTLIVLGDLPEPEQTEIPRSGDRVVYGPKKFNLAFDIDETNDTNYNFHLLVECGGKYKMWFETSDGMLYGGNEGLEVTFKTNHIIQRDRKTLNVISVVATWNSLKSPFRCISPMY